MLRGGTREDRKSSETLDHCSCSQPRMLLFNTSAEECYADGKLSKANFAALQGHQAAVDETKIPQRQREAAANCVLPNQ